jgi:hypothetical protein
MIGQSGPKPCLRGKLTTQPPCQSFQSAYAATDVDAIAVPIAEPAVPKAGIGPSPRMSTMLSTMLRIVIAMPSTIGVRASPAERSAPPSM